MRHNKTKYKSTNKSKKMTFIKILTILKKLLKCVWVLTLLLEKTVWKTWIVQKEKSKLQGTIISRIGLLRKLECKSKRIVIMSREKKQNRFILTSSSNQRMKKKRLSISNGSNNFRNISVIKPSCTVFAIQSKKKHSSKLLMS